jgi:ketosteroid isomerase-like protein
MTDFEPTTDLDTHLAAYTAAFAQGSSDLIDRFYEPDGVVVPQPGSPLTGEAARRTAYDHLLGFGVPLQARTRHLYVVGDVALAVVDWSMRGTARQGDPLDLHGVAADVLRRGRDGRWRFVIDNPFGTA